VNCFLEINKGEYMDIILDNFEEGGASLLRFENALKELDQNTYAVPVNGKDITVIYIPDKITYSNGGVLEEQVINTKEDILSTKSIRVNIFHPNELFSYSESGRQTVKTGSLKIKNIIYHPNAEQLIEELLVTRTILCVKGKFYLTSEVLDKTLYQRIDMNGRGILNHTMLRAAHIAELFNTSDEGIMIVRKTNGVAKVFSILSSKYVHIKQSVLMDIVKNIDPNKELGHVYCRKWGITNHLAYAYLEFPDKAEEVRDTYKLKDDLVPGLLISKSDIGFGAIRISGTWRKGSSISVFQTVSRKQSGNFEVGDIIEEAVIKIYGEYTLLPERLCELMTIDITDSNWFIKLKLEDAIEKNQIACAEAIRTVFNQIHLKKVIQGKREKAVYEELCSVIDPTLSYTAYDICVMILGLSELIPDLNKFYEIPLMECISKAPYVEYKNKVRKVTVA